ncbi:MFS transporter [Mesorhizobium sp. M0145]|uniref:MFS transporter n=1 Tax=Mesorhizobium sp. M0145 TaxID=2956895 RepID=UPI0033381AE8
MGERENWHGFAKCRSAKARPPTSQWTLSALLASAFVVALGYGIVLPVLPMMVERLAGATDPTFNARQIGFLTAAYIAAPVGAAFLSGKWSCLIGRRSVLVVGLIGFAITLAASALAPSLLVLYVGRILNGGFAAAVGPAALAFIADTQGGDDRRTRAFGRMSMASIASFVVGPTLGRLAVGLKLDLGVAAVPPDRSLPSSVRPRCSGSAWCVVCAAWKPAALSSRRPSARQRRGCLWLLPSW